VGTLTDFLLARIAEDERLATEYSGLTPPFPPPWEIGLYYEEGIAMALTVSAARVLAECEAKRRIVALAVDYSPELEHGDNGEWALDSTLLLLAQPHADHPDFDPAWRL
jgi:hypothetical protein